MKAFWVCEVILLHHGIWKYPDRLESLVFSDKAPEWHQFGLDELMHQYDDLELWWLDF
jgi:hypothetical protein